MKLCRTTAELREEIALAKAAGKTIGLVPTMGALHEGHASLIKAAAMENELVVVSVFVNPTQFGPNEDLDAYPRTLDADCKLAESCGADIVFAPTPAEMYPSEDMTWVEVTGDITKVLCGRTRPIHFRGVTTVVAKLFNLAQPDHAYFGQKDAQQADVLKRMVKDLFFNVKLRIMPIVREADGLAKSSRNTYLSKSERAAAVIFIFCLQRLQTKVRRGRLLFGKQTHRNARLSALPAAAEAIRIVAAGGRLVIGLGVAGVGLVGIAVVIGRIRAVGAAGEEPAEQLQKKVRADNLAENSAAARAAISPLILRVLLILVRAAAGLIGVGVAVVVLVRVLPVLRACLRGPEAERIVILLVLLLIRRLLLAVCLLIGALLLLLAICLICLRIFEQVVCLVDLVHLLCAGGVARMEVRVVLLGSLSKGAFYFGLGSVFIDSQYFVIICLCHCFPNFLHLPLSREFSYFFIFVPPQGAKANPLWLPASKNLIV